MVRNQRLGRGGRAMSGRMGIFRNRNTITPTGTVSDGSIDAIVRRAAADDKVRNRLITQQLFERRFIKGIARGFRDIFCIRGRVQFRQQCEPRTPSSSPPDSAC